MILVSEECITLNDFLRLRSWTLQSKKKAFHSILHCDDYARVSMHIFYEVDALSSRDRYSVSARKSRITLGLHRRSRHSIFALFLYNLVSQLIASKGNTVTVYTYTHLNILPLQSRNKYFFAVVFFKKRNTF